MKIDPDVTSTPSSAPSLPGSARTAQGSAATQTASVAATPTATETVSLSPSSTQLNAAFAGTTGDVDLKRVSEIRDQISKGNLVINAGNIADGLIDTVRGLLQQPQDEGAAEG